LFESVLILAQSVGTFIYNKAMNEYIFLAAIAPINKTPAIAPDRVF